MSSILKGSLCIDHRFIQWLSPFFYIRSGTHSIRDIHWKPTLCQWLLVCRGCYRWKKGNNEKKMFQDPNTTTDKYINGIWIPDYYNWSLYKPFSISSLTLGLYSLKFLSFKLLSQIKSQHPGLICAVAGYSGGLPCTSYRPCSVYIPQIYSIWATSCTVFSCLSLFCWYTCTQLDIYDLAFLPFLFPPRCPSLHLFLIEMFLVCIWKCLQFIKVTLNSSASSVGSHTKRTLEIVVQPTPMIYTYKDNFKDTWCID